MSGATEVDPLIVIVFFACAAAGNTATEATAAHATNAILNRDLFTLQLLPLPFLLGPIEALHGESLAKLTLTCDLPVNLM
jgi:hypothetical protein